MKQQLYYIKAIAFVFFLAIANTSIAQSSITWISGVGDDFNPCSRTAPCRTLQAAYDKTINGGEINFLDPAGVGAITITHSVTINGGNSLSSILITSTNGITINAGATDVVTIRGLSIISPKTNAGSNAINFIAGGQVNVEDCSIVGFATTGIRASLTASGSLTVKNTTITTPNSTTSNGVNLSTTTGKLSASLDNVSIQGFPVGMNVSTNVVASISNATIAGNTIGVRAQNNGIINLEKCEVTKNISGIISESANSTIRISNVNIFDNTTGIATNEGKVISFGNNRSAGNINPSAAVGTIRQF